MKASIYIKTVIFLSILAIAFSVPVKAAASAPTRIEQIKQFLAKETNPIILINRLNQLMTQRVIATPAAYVTWYEEVSAYYNRLTTLKPELAARYTDRIEDIKNYNEAIFQKQFEKLLLEARVSATKLKEYLQITSMKQTFIDSIIARANELRLENKQRDLKNLQTAIKRTHAFNGIKEVENALNP